MDASGISSYDKGKHKKEAFPMRKDTETLKHEAEVAQFRFAIDSSGRFYRFLQLQNTGKMKIPVQPGRS